MPWFLCLQLQISPMVKKSDVRDLEFSQRKCLYPDELALLNYDACFSHVKMNVIKDGSDDKCYGRHINLLKQFSKSGCFFECKLNGAYYYHTADKCSLWQHPKITYWHRDHPQLGYTKSERNNLWYCNGNTVKRKKNMIYSDDFITCQTCEYFSNCEEIFYHYSLTSRLIEDRNEWCGRIT